MSGSVKITDVHAEFGLQMDKGSVNRFKRGFSGTVKQLKEGTKEIGFSAVSSLEGVAKQGGFFGSVVGGGIRRGLVTGGLIKAVVAGAVAGMATIGVAAKKFSDEFEKTTDKFADILDTADALNMKIQDIERLKFFANLKGAKYEDFIKLIQQVNKISGNIKKEGLNKDENKLINYIFSGDGSNLSGLQKLDVLTKYFTKLHKEQGEEVAVAEMSKIIPGITKKSALFAALTSGDAELVKSVLEAKVIPESRTKEVRDKVQKGRETVAKKKNEESYNEDIRYIDGYSDLEKTYKAMDHLVENWKDLMHKSSSAVAGGMNILSKGLKFFNETLDVINFLNNIEKNPNYIRKQEENAKRRAEQKTKNTQEIKVELEHKNQQKINVFNNNTSTQSLGNR